MVLGKTFVKLARGLRYVSYLVFDQILDILIWRRFLFVKLQVLPSHVYLLVRLTLYSMRLPYQGMRRSKIFRGKPRTVTLVSRTVFCTAYSCTSIDRRCAPYSLST